LARENSVLQGKVDAGRIDQIDDGQAVAHGDFLGAQNFGDGFGPPCAGFDSGVVGDDDGGALFNERKAGDDAGGGSLAVIAVVSDQQADFEEETVWIDEPGDALPRC